MAKFGLGKVTGARLGAVGKPQMLPIAVDFGTAYLKVLQASPGDAPSLVGAGCVATPEGLLHDPKRRLAFQVEALPELVRSLHLRGTRAVCAIPASFTFCKHAQFPKAELPAIELMADAMLAEQLKRDPASLVKRVIEVEGADRAGTGKGEYIVLAAGRELVDHLMRSMKSARLDPVGMPCEYEAVLRAFTGLSRGAEERATLYLDIGCRGTRVMIAQGARLVFARSIAVGGAMLDECLAKEMASTFEEAHRARMSMEELVVPGSRSGAGGVAVASRGSSLREPVEILTDEVGMCLRYHASLFRDVKVGGVVFLGGEARHRALCQHIARVLRLPAQAGDPLARIARSGGGAAVGVDLTQPQPGWALPVGLCLSPTDL